jgi:hypothetical protein
MQKHPGRLPQLEAHETVCLNFETKDAAASIRILLTVQRLAAHGGPRNEFLAQPAQIGFHAAQSKDELRTPKRQRFCAATPAPPEEQEWLILPSLEHHLDLQRKE